MNPMLCIVQLCFLSYHSAREKKWIIKLCGEQSKSNERVKPSSMKFRRAFFIQYTQKHIDNVTIFLYSFSSSSTFFFFDGEMNKTHNHHVWMLVLPPHKLLHGAHYAYRQFFNSKRDKQKTLKRKHKIIFGEFTANQFTQLHQP